MHNGLSMLKTVRCLALVALASIAWTVVVPGVVAYRANVMFDDDVRNFFPAKATTAADIEKKFRAAQDSYEKQQRAFDAAILRALAEGAPGEGIAALAQAKAQLIKPRSTVAVVGFLSERSTSNYYYLAAYLALGFHLMLCGGFLRPLRRWKVWLPLTALLYVAWMWPNWVRNLFLNGEGRMVISYVHLDVHYWSWALQEARALFLCFLIARSWMRSAERERQLTFKLRDGSEQGFAALASRVEKAFESWQLHSLLLVAAFLPWTFFYWVHSIEFHDSRYYISAITIHLIWALTWLAVSKPAWLAIRTWRNQRRKRLAQLARAPLDSDEGRSREFIRELAPVSQLRLVFSSIVSVASFLIPFVEILR